MPEDLEILVSPYFKELLLELSRIKSDEKKQSSGQTINVSEVASLAAFIYERLRQAIDFQEEHLLRRITIERILRRRLTTESLGDGISYLLIRELIWARYLKNNSVPQEKVAMVGAIIDKYMPLIKASFIKIDKKERENDVDWVIGVLASEIEKTLVSSEETDAFITFIYKILLSTNGSAETEIVNSDKRLWLFVAIQKAFAKADDPILRFHLLLYYCPKWLNPSDSEYIQQVVLGFSDLKEKIEKNINNPENESLLRKTKKLMPSFLVLRDTLRRDFWKSDSDFVDFTKAEEEIRTVCDEKYADTKAKLRRMGVRSIIYIFITKMIFGVAIEVPYDTIILRRLDVVPLLINTITPPFLMFLVTATIRAPETDNTEKMLQKIREIVFGPIKSFRVSFRSEEIKQKINPAFSVVYFLMFLASFGLIFWFLNKLAFSIASGAIFIFFLSVVSFFAYRISLSARELAVTEKKDGLFTPLLDFFAIPVLRLGHFLSSGFIKINIFTFIFDFIIEAPLKIIIGIFEDWMSYIRGKKDEIV